MKHFKLLGTILMSGMIIAPLVLSPDSSFAEEREINIEQELVGTSPLTMTKKPNEVFGIDGTVTGKEGKWSIINLVKKRDIMAEVQGTSQGNEIYAEYIDPANQTPRQSKVGTDKKITLPIKGLGLQVSDLSGKYTGWTVKHQGNVVLEKRLSDTETKDIYCDARFGITNPKARETDNAKGINANIFYTDGSFKDTVVSTDAGSFGSTATEYIAMNGNETNIFSATKATTNRPTNGGGNTTVFHDGADGSLEVTVPGADNKI